MYNFSISINDIVAEGLEGKIDICSRLMINNMEIDDRLGSFSIADINGEQTENCRRLLISNNKKIVLLNCSEPVDNLDYYKKIFRKAHLLNIKNIRVQCNGDRYDDSFIEGLKTVCETGGAYGIRVLLENCSTTFLSADKTISEIFRKEKGLNLGLIFNPLEFARLKVHPFFHVFYNSRLKNDIVFLRVNDGLFPDGSPVLPAMGNAEIKELASIMLARGFRGYFSFAPYFSQMDYSKYVEIIHMFKGLLMEM